MISLIITTCDRPALLARAVESALNQEYVGEIIVINDGRKPPGKLDAAVRTIDTKGYTGICAARNLGLSAASLPYVAYLDDDDLLHPDAYLGAVDAFRAGARHVVVLNVETFQGEEKLAERVPPSTAKGTIWGMDNDALQGGFDFLTKQSAVYQTDFLRWIGGWEERLKSRSQTDLFFRISQNTDITGIDQPCYRLNRTKSYAHLTDRLGRRFKSYLFLVIHHFALWSTRKNGWRWLVQETRNLLIRVRQRYISPMGIRRRLEKTLGSQVCTRTYHR